MTIKSIIIINKSNQLSSFRPHINSSKATPSKLRLHKTKHQSLPVITAFSMLVCHRQKLSQNQHQSPGTNTSLLNTSGKTRSPAFNSPYIFSSRKSIKF